jgi:flavodoxin
MKPLIIYYSRTGNTRTIAKTLQHHIKGDIEEILDTKKRSGPLGWIRSGRQAIAKKTTTIKDITHDLNAYDCIIIGTPVWAGTISTPVRTFLEEYKEKLSTIAFFTTSGGGNTERSFEEMQRILEKQPLARLSIREEQLSKQTYDENVKTFSKELTDEFNKMK